MTTPDPTPAERREWAEGLLLDATVTNWPDVEWFSAALGWAVTDAALPAAAPDLAAAVRDLADELANRDAILDAVAQSVDALLAERDALREQVERQAAALREIAEYGGGDGGDWVECCEVARAALAEEPQP